MHRLPSEKSAIFSGDCPSPRLVAAAAAAVAPDPAASAAASGPVASSTSLSSAPARINPAQPPSCAPGYQSRRRLLALIFLVAEHRTSGGTATRSSG